MTLVVADDRASLLSPSSIEYADVCPSGTPGAPAATTVSDAEVPEGTRITRRGRFAWRERLGRTRLAVAGGFERRGRVVRGTLTLRSSDPARAACPEVVLSFRARLSGRPYRPRAGRVMRCPRPFGFFGFGINVQPLHVKGGCTAAIELADRWRRKRACRSGPTRLHRCVVAGHVCEPTWAAELSPLAGVRCSDARHPAARYELVVGWGCNGVDTELVAEAINVSCATARAVLHAWADETACSEPRAVGAACTPLTGWRCRALVADFEPAGLVSSRCRRTGSVREAVEVAWVLPP
ncbi:hypothetical protein [Solirubrobacter soli]|uniref:hypothetical protein n=1 Tax=Solirubrobacter soli TaxID=363832 RepID=UPI0012FA3A65|nr:hypothetical protein [Solirubrobacter soli]